MKQPDKPELLAPAGSLESFFAALEKGADAVYAGLRDFSARARAKNFTLSQMERMLAYAHAHARDKRIYITLNTLVKEKELPQLVDTLSALAAMRIDGIIVQDLAVARLAHKFFPTIPLHASTQMTIHNTPGVRMLAKLGFQRVVLARELAIDEIAAIATATPTEIEVFVHGALCFSISGQCFFSSYLGGHSGNRGRCAQPCRRLYAHRGKQGHYFSTSDLSAIDMLPELMASGVKSLKIEGRMKSAEYVASVVEAYRLVLDAPERSRKDALSSAKELLKYSFGRTPTRGFLGSQQPDDIANPWQKGGTGRFIGQIKGINGKRLTFETRDALHVGDRLRAQPKTDMAGQAWTLRELFCNRKKVMEAKAGSLVEVESPFHFAAGDAVYKVSSSEAFTLSENACMRRLDSVKKDKLPCRLSISAEIVPSLTGESGGQTDSNHGGYLLRIRAQISGASYDFSFPLGQLAAAHSSDMQKVLEGQFEKTGDTPFKLESLEAPGFPHILIPSVRFKELRRQLYQQLEKAVLDVSGEEVAESRRNATQELAAQALVPAGSRTQNRETLTVIIDQPREWRSIFQAGADSILFPLSKGLIHQLPSILPRLRGSEDKIIFQLPFIIFDRDYSFYADTIKQLYRYGFRRFEAANISHFELLQKLEGVRISTWHRCFSTNSQALKAWEELGAEAAALYLEDDADNIAILLAAATKIEKQLLVYAHLPVMTTKIRIKDVHSNIPLHSDRGEEYSVTTRDGLQTISALKPFSLTARHQELRQRGCFSFVIDLRQSERGRWAEIIGAFKAGRQIPGTTEFNYAAELI